MGGPATQCGGGSSVSAPARESSGRTRPEADDAAGVERLTMYHVYVLQSLKNGRRYVGFTSQDVQSRLKQHHSGTNRWTKQNGPFRLLRIESFPDSRTARARERFLKSGHGREFLNQTFPSAL